MYFCSNQIVRTFGNWEATALSWLYNHTRSYTVGLAECSGKFVAAWNSVARLLSLPPVKLLTKLYFAQSVCSFVKPQFVKIVKYDIKDCRSKRTASPDYYKVYILVSARFKKRMLPARGNHGLALTWGHILLFLQFSYPSMCP